MGHLGPTVSRLRYKSKYHNKMPKLMLVDGTRQNSASNSQNHQQLPILRNKSSILNIFSNVGVLTFCIVFSIACLSFSNAQPYKTNVNDINWARYVAPSPVEMGQDPYIEYGDDDNSVEDGIIEEEPEKETKKMSHLHMKSWTAFLRMRTKNRNLERMACGINYKLNNILH